MSIPDDLDPHRFATRAALVSVLATRYGWPTPRLARVFEVGEGTIRRELSRATRPAAPAPMTDSDRRRVLSEIAADPSTLAEDREALRAWLASKG